MAGQVTWQGRSLFCSLPHVRFLDTYVNDIGAHGAARISYLSPTTQHNTDSIMKEDVRLHIWKVVEEYSPYLAGQADSLESVFRTAIETRDRAVVALLLKNGYPVEGRTAYGRGLCPLAHAAWYGRLEIIDQLLEAGASVRDEDECGYSVIEHLVREFSPRSGLIAVLTDRQAAEVARRILGHETYTDKEHEDFAVLADNYKHPLLAAAIRETAPCRKTPGQTM